MNKKGFGARLLAVVVCGLPVLGLAAQVEGSVDVTLLDKTYTRAAGAPTATVDNFPALPGTATLTVLNLGDVGQRVSSAVVRVNGVVVFGPEDFSQHAARLEAAIEVARQNELSVELRGQPGGRLNLVVLQRIDADAGAVVGPAGGSVRVEDAGNPLVGATVSVPPGAIAETTLITIKAAPNAPVFSDGLPGISAVDLQPSGLTFDIPASLTLPYRDSDLDPELSLGEDTLSIFDFDEQAGVWVGLPTEPVDTAGNLVSSTALTHFSPKAAKPDTLDTRCVRPNANSPYLPVLLVHGIQPVLGYCGWGHGGTWGNLAQLLDGEEDVAVCELNYNTSRDMRDSAKTLRRAIDKLLDFGKSADGTRPGGVTLVAHSMGGLVARYAVQNNDSGVPETIRRLATLATPHLGSDSAIGTLTCSSGRQLLPGSGFLRDLNSSIRTPNKVPELPGCGTDFYLYAGNADWVVAQESALANTWHYGVDLSVSPPIPVVFDSVFEPPAIATERRIKEVVNGCGDGEESCGHVINGIANVDSKNHVMWSKLTEIIRSEPWFSGAKQCAPGPGGRLFYLNRPNQASTAWSIWETDLDRQASQKLTDLTGFFSPSDLVVSSDGRRLAFWATLGGGWDGGASGEVYVLNTDPTNVNLHQVTSLPGAPFASAPRWSPSNRDILYYQYNPGSGNPNESIRKLDLRTSQTTTYPQGYGQAAKGWDIGDDETDALIVREPGCCWHPNAFTAYYDLASGVVQTPFVQASDGRSESSPRINRTDGWIAFLDEVQGATGIADIFLMDPSGGAKVAVTNAPAASRFGAPVWAGGDHTGYVVIQTTFFGAWEIVAMRAGDAWPDGVIHLTGPQANAPAGDNLTPAWTAKR